MDLDGEIEGEVTRFEAVRYLQGALGHAVGSLLFVLLGGLLWMLTDRILALVSITAAFLLSANGLSIWAWDRLRAYFAARTARSGVTGSTRTLRARPFSDESRVEILAGAVMILAFVGLLVVGRFALGFLGPRRFGFLFVGCLSLGNVVALAVAIRGSPESSE